jgi:hypothetical protein
VRDLQQGKKGGPTFYVCQGDAAKPLLKAFRGCFVFESKISISKKERRSLLNGMLSSAMIASIHVLSWNTIIGDWKDAFD